jgi:hypothetical protein
VIKKFCVLSPAERKQLFFFGSDSALKNFKLLRFFGAVADTA